MNRGFDYENINIGYNFQYTITHTSTKNGDKTSIDFSKLDKRCCANHGKLTNNNSLFYADYKLYM